MKDLSLKAPRRSRLFGGSGLFGPLVALVFAVAMPLPASAPAKPVLDLDSPSSERTISFFNLHTKERLTVTYKRNGRYDSAAMAKINHILRDWRRDETLRMDPELIDLVYELHRDLGSKEPIGIVSGYRSPKTNAMLRKRSGGVAKRSQHMLGKAMDLWFPDVPLSKLREMAFVHEEGGVGYYPNSGRPFVHVDTGRVRSWPRMSRDQLARLFPDGNTRHIPADGKPLPRKVRTQDIQLARVENIPLPTERPAPADREVPPDRPVLIPRAAQADRPVQVASVEAETDDESDEGFLSALFGSEQAEEPETTPETTEAKTQQTIAASLELPEGPSAPVPVARPVLALADDGDDAPLTTASLAEPAAADGGDAEPRTITDLLDRDAAESGAAQPMALSYWDQGPQPADSAYQPLTIAARWNLEAEPAPGGNEAPETTTAIAEPETEPADRREEQPADLASLWEQGAEHADVDGQPLTVASRWTVEAETPASSEQPEWTTASPSKPEPAESRERSSLNVASLWAHRPEAAGQDRQPLTTASLPKPAQAENASAVPPMALASLGPVSGAPASQPQRPVFKRDLIGIWSGGLHYEPPAVDALVAGERMHGEAFATFTAPDQSKIAGLMRAPAQSLTIRFVRGQVLTPYAEAFVGTAIAPLKVADLSAPLVTAAR